MSNLSIEKSQWNGQSASHLILACDDDYTLDDLAVDVQKGELSLFKVYQNKNHCASMVLRLENNTNAKELVVVALGGRFKGGSLIENLSSFWDDLAIKNGAGKIRAHVSKKGMAKMMERVGGVLSEYVYKKEVNYGR